MVRRFFSNSGGPMAFSVVIIAILTSAEFQPKADAQAGYNCNCQNKILSALSEFGKLECQHGSEFGGAWNSCANVGTPDPDPRADPTSPHYDPTYVPQDANCERLFEVRMAICPDHVSGTCPAGVPVAQKKFETKLKAGCTSCTNDGTSPINPNDAQACKGTGGAQAACLTDCCEANMAVQLPYGNGEKCP